MCLFYEDAQKLFAKYFRQRNKGLVIKYGDFGRSNRNPNLHLAYPYNNRRHNRLEIRYIPSSTYSIHEFINDLSCILPIEKCEEKITLELDKLGKEQWDFVSFTGCKERLDYMVPKHEFRNRGRGKEIKPFLLLIVDIETNYIGDPIFYDYLKENPEADIYPEISKTLIVIPFTIQVKIYKSDMPVRISYWAKDKHKELFNWYSELEKEYTLLFIAHNGAFDFKHLRRVYELYDSRVFLKFDGQNTLLSGESTGKHKHYFFCSYFLIRQSLEKAVGTKKLFFPYGIFCPVIDFKKGIIECSTLGDETIKTYSLKDLEAYAIKDVLDTEIVLKAVEDRARVYEKDFDLVSYRAKYGIKPAEFDFIRYICKSNAGMGANYVMSYLAETFKVDEKTAKENIYNSLFRYEIEEEEYWRRKLGIHAGLCFYNRKQSVFKAPKGFKIISLDISSSYPYIMTQGLPAGEFIDEIKKSEQSKYITWVLLRSKEPIKYKEGRKTIIEYPQVLPEFEYLENESYLHNDLFRKGGTEFYITKDYLNLLFEVFGENLNKHIEIVQERYQLKNYLIGECISKKMYQKKLQIDKDLETEKELNKIVELNTARQCYKVWMNSIYGKLVQQTYEREKYYTNGDYMKNINEGVIYRNLSTGSYIALEGRTRLLKQLLKIHRNKEMTIISGDTDSITFMAPENIDLTKVFDLYSKNKKGELGVWTLKGEYNEGYLFGAQKKYIFVNSKSNLMSSAFAGVKKVPELLTNLWNNNKDRFYEFLELLLNNRDEIGFIGGKTRKCEGKENKEDVIWDQTVGITSKVGNRKKLNYSILIKIDYDCKDYSTIPAHE